MRAEDAGITPDATIDILQNRVWETENKLDALEDLARSNGIEPGILHGQIGAIDSSEAIVRKDED